jgi:hypothetical protein
MTIFGFNTDVKLGDVVYHVQSEARQADLLLQTLVFVQGQCVGKRAVSYAQKISEPHFSEQAMHELLKIQHKAMLDALKQGQSELVLGHEADIEDVGNGGLTLKWTNPSELSNGASLSMSFQVLDKGAAACGAEIAVGPISPADAASVASASTDVQGGATINVPLSERMSEESAVMVRASHGGKSATRKFRFKK